MTKLAWQIERELRDAAVPLDRRVHESNWYTSETEFPTGDKLIDKFWFSNVPGSGAPEIPYLEMAQAAHTKGLDTSAVVEKILAGIELHKQGKVDELRALTAEILHDIYHAQPDPNHPYHSYQHPAAWEDVRAAMGEVTDDPIPFDRANLGGRIHQSWLGQLAGGSFGTCIEGYTTAQIEKVYGEIRSYITPPETTNDDVVYELVLLDVFERMGRGMSSLELSKEWIKQIPFGWSAEWIALDNLSHGIFPPESGSFHNPYSNWIGAQMRGMVCGLLAPGWPMEAARLAHIDGVISHDNNGVYGEMYAAALTALAFVRDEPREILREAAQYIPRKSLYADVVDFCLRTCEANEKPAEAWKILDKKYEQYNWIDTHPNIAAVIFALWYGQTDMTECFALLAHAGLDVDCNGGLVGSVLGAIKPVPAQWADPLGDLLETYLKGKERLSIRELAEKTARLAL